MRSCGGSRLTTSRTAAAPPTCPAIRSGIRNPKGFRDYGEHVWGVTASNGPGPATRRVRGRARRCCGCQARGVPSGPDDGTLAPWAVAASLPFAPEIVLPTLEHFSGTPTPTWQTSTGWCAASIPRFRFPWSATRLDLEQGSFRAGSRTGDLDDRKLSIGSDLASVAKLSVPHGRPPARRIQRRLVDSPCQVES